MQATILDPVLAASDQRFRTHHSHFWHRMRDFVALRHPQLAKWIGEPELLEIVRRYVVTHPPDTCVASKVGARLARFLTTTEPWSAHPIIAELAAYDFQRSGAASNAEEATVTREQIAEAEPRARTTVMLRLKKRTALVTARFRFHAVPLAKLERTTPLDARPTYLLVQMANRRAVATELDHRAYLAFGYFARGGTLIALTDALRELDFTWTEIDTLFARCLDADLLVAEAA
jgi:hypothetical protein